MHNAKLQGLESRINKLNSINHFFSAVIYYDPQKQTKEEIDRIIKDKEIEADNCGFKGVIVEISPPIVREIRSE